MTEEKQDLIKELSDVNPENYFRVANGIVVKNLKELDKAIENMGDETFKCHVSEVRNDFSNWIREVIKDEKLADELLHTKDRYRTQLLILRRIVEILTKCQKFSKG
jgi:hypothetical protein